MTSRNRRAASDHHADRRCGSPAHHRSDCARERCFPGARRDRVQWPGDWGQRSNHQGEPLPPESSLGCAL